MFGRTQTVLLIAFVFSVVSHAAATMMVPDLEAGDSLVHDMGMLVSELEIAESKPEDAENAMDEMERKEKAHNDAVAAGLASGPFQGDLEDGKKPKKLNTATATGPSTASFTGATGATGATGTTGATGATDESSSGPLDVAMTVTFKGKKGKQFVCYECRDPPAGMPERYHERVSMRKSRDEIKSVLSDFPDKIKDFHLSPDARCVNSDPYFPEYYDPIGLDNPTPERQAVRDFAEEVKNLKNMSSLHKGEKALEDFLVSHGDKGIDIEAEDKKLVNNTKDQVAVEMVKQIAHKVQNMAMKRSYQDTNEGINNVVKELKAAEAKKLSQNE